MINKLKKPILVAGLIAATGMLAVIGFIGLGAIYVIFARDIPITDHDREILVTVHDVAPYYEDFEPSSEFEILSKERYFDASQELSYEYDSPRDDEPYISVTITHERKRSDAMMIYGIEWSAQKLGLNIFDQDLEVIEDNNFYQVGDISRFGHIKLNGETLGHVLVSRINNTIYSFSISGFVLDDPDIWRELFDDRLKKLSKKNN